MSQKALHSKIKEGVGTDSPSKMSNLGKVQIKFSGNKNSSKEIFFVG